MAKSAKSKLGESGTDHFAGKSHEADISLGEGLAHGSVHSTHEKHKVRDAKHVKGLQMAAQAAHERRENGGADPTGDCGM